MSGELVDSKGAPLRVAESIALCPGCGSSKKHHKTLTSFGGFWKRVCESCGHIFADGRGEVPEEHK